MIVTVTHDDVSLGGKPPTLEEMIGLHMQCLNAAATLANMMTEPLRNAAQHAIAAPVSPLHPVESDIVIDEALKHTTNDAKG